MTKAEVEKLIRSFIDGSCGDWDWDDFTSVKHSDPELEKIRQRIIDIGDFYRSDNPTHWCNAEGITVLLEIAESLSPENMNIKKVE